MRLRNTLLAAAATMYVGTQADAQSAANQSGAQLLLPLTTLQQTAAGRQALADNLASTIAVNNNASAARRQQAVSDNTQNGNGSQFTNGLGTTLDAAYQAAVANKDPLVTAITGEITPFTNASGGDTTFGKYFFANGTTNGTTPATGPALPMNGAVNVYDAAYLTATSPGRDPYGDSRPFQVSNQIQVVSATINAGLTSNPAFPSGHTTFGTTIALLEAMAIPERFSTEIARGLDYGYSRVVLGVHYSFDVIAGRIEALHAVANALNGNANYAVAGVNYTSTLTQLATNLRAVLTKYDGGTSVAAAAAADTGQYAAANTAQVKSDAAFRGTYGISATGPTNAAPVVPDGAEVLLSTRFAYLSAQQRRDVLASTEFASGAALDDGSGWARIDLYTAGNGYGSFTGQTTINQDASAGGLSAADTWSNDISGTGGFTHTGTGSLTLTGNNSYAGGTTVAGGTVVAGSQTALGTGNVAVTGGTLQVARSLTVGGNYAQGAGGTLVLTEAGQGTILNILGAATLDGQLKLSLGSYGAGTGVYELLGWGSHTGQFAGVAYDGLAGGETAALDYRADGLFLSLTAAVPEPATWTSMMLGLGVMGGALRRRRGQGQQGRAALA